MRQHYEKPRYTVEVENFEGTGEKKTCVCETLAGATEMKNNYLKRATRAGRMIKVEIWASTTITTISEYDNSRESD